MDRKQAESTSMIQNEEFSRQKVPQSERKSWINLLAVSLGYVFVVTSMQAGGSIGIGLNFTEAFWAIILSSVILTVLACIMGVIASKSGLTLGLLSQFSFGKIGTYVPVAIVVITTIGWFSIDAYLIGQSTNALFPAIPIFPIAIVGGIGMTLTALRGMKWMTWLSNLAVPLIVIFGTISMVVAVRSQGGLTGMAALQPNQNIPFSQAVALGVGSYAVGAVMFTPDIMRFAKSTKVAVAVMTITMMLGNTFVVLSGTIGGITTGSPDIAIVLSMQGLLAPAFLVLVLNIWSTAQGCVYSGSMSLSSVTRLHRPHIVIGFGIIGIIFALVGFYNYFGSYINFLATTVPPLAGIFLADFLITYRRHYPDQKNKTLPTVNWSGFISWLVAFLSSRIQIGLPVVNCIIVAFLLKAILSLVWKQKTAS